MGRRNLELYEGLPEWLQQHVDCSSRSGLRERLADGIALFLHDHEAPVASRLPSLRHLAQRLDVHRNTVKAALDVLADRGVLTRDGAGTFRTTPPIVSGSPLADNPVRVVRQAAQALAEQGVSEREVTAIVRNVFREWVATTRADVVFVRPTLPSPDVTAARLGALLERTVRVSDLDGVAADHRGGLVTAVSGDLAAVRAAVGPGVDVFPLGASLESDLRLATARVPEAHRVVVYHPDRAALDAVAGRLSAMRPDLDVRSTDSLPETLPPDVARVLVPTGSSAAHIGPGVATFRTGISPAEISLICAHLDAPRTHDVMASTPNASASSSSAIASIRVRG